VGTPIVGVVPGDPILLARRQTHKQSPTGQFIGAQIHQRLDPDGLDPSQGDGRCAHSSAIETTANGAA